MPKNILISVATALVVVAIASSANADLVISKKQTVNVNCSAGVCNATAADAVLNIKDLTAMLATSDVHVFAEGAATDITVADPFGWASVHQLTLGAYGSLNVKAAISVTGTSGLTIAANVAQTGGIFRLVGIGKISFWDTASSLIINGTPYTLVNNLPALINGVASNSSGAYALSQDYDAAQDGSYPFSPIPTTFNGIFEGLGNAIGNLSIYNSNGNNEYISLFKDVGSGGQLKDVVLTNISMQVAAAYLAPLVGINDGTITHSSATGTLSELGSSTTVMAGLVAENSGFGTITRSHAGVTMVGLPQWAGGLCAGNDGTISLSDASGAVKAVYQAGGLAGSSSGTIAQSSASGDVSVSLDHGAEAGGLAGQIAGTVTESFATGNVSGGTGGAKAKQRSKSSGLLLGGLVGYSFGTIHYAYARGSVTAVAGRDAKHAEVGGLVGSTAANPGFSHITQAYSLGHISLNDKKFIGGLIGVDLAAQGSNILVFWDLDTSGITNPNQGAGNLFDDPGLRGVADSRIRKAMQHQFDNGVWAEDSKINNGYPYLINNPPRQ